MHYPTYVDALRSAGKLSTIPVPIDLQILDQEYEYRGEIFFDKEEIYAHGKGQATFQSDDKFDELSGTFRRNLPYGIVVYKSFSRHGIYIAVGEMDDTTWVKYTSYRNGKAENYEWMGRLIQVWPEENFYSH